MSNFKQQQQELIRNAEHKIDTFDALLLKGVECTDILVHKNSVEVCLSKEYSTVEVLTTILDNFELSYRYFNPTRDKEIYLPMKVVTSSIIGIYLLIHTVEYDFRLILSETSISKYLEALTVVEGDWNSDLNCRTQVGAWGIQHYQGGELTFYPRRQFRKDQIINYLNPLLYEKNSSLLD